MAPIYPPLLPYKACQIQILFVTEWNTESILDVYEHRKGSSEDENMISVEKDNKEDKQKKDLRGKETLRMSACVWRHVGILFRALYPKACFDAFLFFFFFSPNRWY